jgi:hypothetical protein
MKKLACFSDVAFAFTAAFLPSLCYLRYRQAPLLWAAMVSLLFGVGASMLTWSYLKRKYAAATLKKSEKRQMEQLLLHLALLSPKENMDFFTANAHALFGEEIEGRRLSAGKQFFYTSKQIIYCRFALSPLGADELTPLLSLEDNRTTVLLCNELDEKAKKLAAAFGVEVLTLPTVYLRLKESNRLPEGYKGEAAFTKKKKRRFSLWIQKSNAKPFLTGGALLLLSSLFSPFPYYYLVVGCAMITASAAVRIFGK